MHALKNLIYLQFHMKLLDGMCLIHFFNELESDQKNLEHVYNRCTCQLNNLNCRKPAMFFEN